MLKKCTAIKTLALVLVISVQTQQALAAPVGAKVIGAPASDPLNVRKWPSTSSAVQRTYVNGTILGLTGRCKNTATNVSFAVSSPADYVKMKKPNVWCQIWHQAPNSTGSWKNGWARGRHLMPQ